MRKLLFGIWLLAALFGCAAHADPGAPLAPPVSAPAIGSELTEDSSVDAILDALDRCGKDLKEFTTDVGLTETDDATQLSSMRSGKVWYQAKGDARMRVLFEKRTAGKKSFDEKLEYLLEGGWLTDRDYKKQIEVRRQVVAPGEKINLLKLGQGPFPLPIGQDKAEVHKLFEVKKVASGEHDPANTVHVALKPKEKTPLARKFSSIDVWVDRKTHFPIRIETLDANETTLRTTDLSNVKINPEPALTDADFTLPPIDNTWDQHTEEFKG